MWCIKLFENIIHNRAGASARWTSDLWIMIFVYGTKINFDRWLVPFHSLWFKIQIIQISCFISWCYLFYFKNLRKETAFRVIQNLIRIKFDIRVHTSVLVNLNQTKFLLKIYRECSNHSVMRHYAVKKKVLYCGAVIVILIILLHPDRNARRTYTFIAQENVLKSLRQEIGNNFSSTVIAECDYYDVVHDGSTLPLSIAEGDLVENHRIREGGEYAPADCRPKFSTAIIVPYR